MSRQKNKCQRWSVSQLSLYISALHYLSTCLHIKLHKWVCMYMKEVKLIYSNGGSKHHLRICIPYPNFCLLLLFLLVKTDLYISPNQNKILHKYQPSKGLSRRVHNTKDYKRKSLCDINPKKLFQAAKKILIVSLCLN